MLLQAALFLLLLYVHIFQSEIKFREQLVQLEAENEALRLELESRRDTKQLEKELVSEQTKARQAF